jgi:hypothetical protein
VEPAAPITDFGLKCCWLTCFETRIDTPHAILKTDFNDTKTKAGKFEEVQSFGRRLYSKRIPHEYR